MLIHPQGVRTWLNGNPPGPGLFQDIEPGIHRPCHAWPPGRSVVETWVLFRCPKSVWNNFNHQIGGIPPKWKVSPNCIWNHRIRYTCYMKLWSKIFPSRRPANMMAIHLALRILFNFDFQTSNCYWMRGVQNIQLSVIIEYYSPKLA